MRENRAFRPTRVTRFFLVVVVGLCSILASPRIPFQQSEYAKAARQENVFLPVALNGNILEDSPSPPPPPDYAGWLSYLNHYRSLAGLLPVSENESWARGSWYHSRYMVKNDEIGHGEDPGNAWYTPEGDLAAQSSNLVASYNQFESDNYAIESWMQAPFHALHILNPTLKQVGFGSFREEDGGLQMGATLDVLRGLGELQASVKFPIFWPGNGATVPLATHWGEYPDPLSSCPGYERPSGLPILVQLGPGDITPNVTAHTVTNGKTNLEHCIFDETSYQNNDVVAQGLGRRILGSRDAVVLIPRDPLEAGASYTVSITANGQSYTWTFKVASQPSRLDTLSGSITVEFFIPEASLMGLPAQ